MISINAEYGTTADGLMAARIDYLALIAIPSRDGRGFRVATALCGSKPICEWSASDGLGSDGQVADEAGFRGHVEECLLHLRQRDALGRATIYLPVSTPWGPSQSATRYAEGIICHETASHGGFHLDAKRNGAMHPALRLPNGWYEEDGDWARVATAYPELFTEREKRAAEKILRDWMPDAWEAVHGRLLGRSESFTRDREGFARDHAADWIVISAARSPVYSGDVVGTATIGGHRGNAPTRSFLIPGSEYDAGRHGFVIDTELRELPEYETSTLHIVAGLLLPIWKRMPKESTRVYRLQTDAGERIIGRKVSPAWATSVTGDGAVQIEVAEAWRILVAGDIALEIAEGQTLRWVRAMNDWRIELSGFNDLGVERLKAMGLISEIVSWKLKLYVPAGAAGADVFAALVDRFPIVRVQDRKAA